MKISIENIQETDIDRVWRDYRWVGAEITMVPQWDGKYTLKINIPSGTKYPTSGIEV